MKRSGTLYKLEDDGLVASRMKSQKTSSNSENKKKTPRFIEGKSKYQTIKLAVTNR